MESPAHWSWNEETCHQNKKDVAGVARCWRKDAGPVVAASSSSRRCGGRIWKRIGKDWIVVQWIKFTRVVDSSTSACSRHDNRRAMCGLTSLRNKGRLCTLQWALWRRLSAARFVLRVHDWLGLLAPTRLFALEASWAERVQGFASAGRDAVQGHGRCPRTGRVCATRREELVDDVPWLRHQLVWQWADYGTEAVCIGDVI